MAMDIVTVKNPGVCAVVEYDYTAKEPDELDLAKGAIIHSIKQIPGGWWEGTLQAGGKTGMFPDNFVRILDLEEENTVTLREKSSVSNRRCKVIYSYTQVNDDELSLGVGDVIEFLGEVEEGWWRGRLKNKVGVFPSNFVISIEQSPKLASKRPPSTIKTANNSNNIQVNNIAKKTNRLSFHNSKEDLLTSSSGVSSTTSNIAVTNISSSSTSVLMSSNADEVAPSLPPKPQREYCRVEYPYAPQNEDELELKLGDIITIISTELPDKGWWKGELRGKVGVFPDNFVKIVPPVSPANDLQELQQTQNSHRTANKTSTLSTATSIDATSAAAAGTTTTQVTTSNNNNSSLVTSTSTTSKVFIKKSGSSSSTQSSQRKESFGSRDSLNDILTETGLPTGNVAAQRKSLENKNLDLSKKQPQLTETAGKNLTTISSVSVSSGVTNELRKSLENMDEKTKTPPPVLTKKPSVPTKKSNTVSTVAGNLLQGFKQRVKTVENKLTTATSHDSADGVGSSRMSISPSDLPNIAPSGSIVMRRAATIAGEETEFDHVERGSMLPDMRAGRVRAPKRRPPSAAINLIGESNNNNSIYLNGNNGEAQQSLNEQDNNNKSSDENSTSEDPQLAKPKPREWEKKKAPWMDELIRSQVRKKTSPNVDRNSKLLDGDVDSNLTKVQSSSISSSVMQQSMIVESSSSNSSSSMKKEEMSSSMSKSVSNRLLTETVVNTSSVASNTTSSGTTAVGVDDVRARPSSLSIRNRSVSPSVNSARSSGAKSGSIAPTTDSLSNNLVNNGAKSTSTVVVNNHHKESREEVVSDGKTRVLELERRVDNLETIVQTQQHTIEELVRLLREETERVKALRGELDKYAQCVTQV